MPHTHTHIPQHVQSCHISTVEAKTLFIYFYTNHPFSLFLFLSLRSVTTQFYICIILEDSSHISTHKHNISLYFFNFYLCFFFVNQSVKTNFMICQQIVFSTLFTSIEKKYPQILLLYPPMPHFHNAFVFPTQTKNMLP